MAWSILLQMGHACTQARARAQPAYALTSSRFSRRRTSKTVLVVRRDTCTRSHKHAARQRQESVLGPNLQG